MPQPHEQPDIETLFVADVQRGREFIISDNATIHIEGHGKIRIRVRQGANCGAKLRQQRVETGCLNARKKPRRGQRPD